MHTNRSSLPANTAHRDCATHLAEWCPPCYYAGGPLPSSDEPCGACVTERDLWTFRPGAEHTVRIATAFMRRFPVLRLRDQISFSPKKNFQYYYYYYYDYYHY